MPNGNDVRKLVEEALRADAAAAGAGLTVAEIAAATRQHEGRVLKHLARLIEDRVVVRKPLWDGSGRNRYAMLPAGPRGSRKW